MDFSEVLNYDVMIPGFAFDNVIKWHSPTFLTSLLDQLVPIDEDQDLAKSNEVREAAEEAVDFAKNNEVRVAAEEAEDFIMSADPSYKYCFGDSYYKYFGRECFKKVIRVNCMISGCNENCAKHHTVDSSDDEITELISPNDVYIPYVQAIQPYTPDNDHCYYAPAKTEIPVQSPCDTEGKLDVLENIPTPPSTSESSSDDEVDVVTVPEEYELPAVPQYEAPRRSTRASRSVTKPQKTYTVSAKSLKAAMKRTRMQQQSVSVARRPYRRRKVDCSVEITPTSSIPSSAHSSRCNSDVEDVDKRRTHNSSERKRREAQRTALQNLRVCIPDLQTNSKAPKVLILNSATALVKKLEHNKRTMKELRLREMQRKSDLTVKLNQLRMQLKMHIRLQ